MAKYCRGCAGIGVLPGHRHPHRAGRSTRAAARPPGCLGLVDAVLRYARRRRAWSVAAAAAVPSGQTIGTAGGGHRRSRGADRLARFGRVAAGGQRGRTGGARRWLAVGHRDDRLPGEPGRHVCSSTAAALGPPRGRPTGARAPHRIGPRGHGRPRGLPIRRDPPASAPRLGASRPMRRQPRELVIEPARLRPSRGKGTPSRPGRR